MNLIEGNGQRGRRRTSVTTPFRCRARPSPRPPTRRPRAGNPPGELRVDENPESDDGVPIDVGVVEELGADAFIYGTLTGIAEDELITAQQIVARIHGGRTAAAPG